MIKRSINALSLAPDACDWLANSRHPRILQVFEQACNLINERREVLSIVTSQIGNGPFNLVVPKLRKSFEGLPVEDDSQQTSEVFSNINLQSFDLAQDKSQVSVSATQLTLGDLTIHTAKSKLWNPSPDWEGFHRKRDRIFTQLALLPISEYQPSLPTSLLSTLITCIVTVNVPLAITTTEHLAGLGIGLTPAGDDFIMGAALAAWIIHSPEIAKTLAREITNTAAPLTTSLSAAWLRSAGKGEAGILWHNFFDALISADDVQIQGAMDNILAVGETSGADALAGFIGAFRCWAELENSKNS